MNISLRKSWDIISKNYQKGTKISLDDVHYGPISAGERELNLLGEIKGKEVLELGCGGGQNSIILSKWGANVVGIDQSKEQIKYAERLARKENVDVKFTIRNIENLNCFLDNIFDIVLSSFAFDFVDDLSSVFSETKRILKNNGVFVFCMTHPIASSGEWINKEKRFDFNNYFSRSKIEYTWRYKDGTSAPFYMYHHTTQELFDLLICSGFTILRIIEPVPFKLEEMSIGEKKKIPYLLHEEALAQEYEMYKKIPQTIIFKAKKTMDEG